MNNRMLLLWVAGGAGMILLYAAYKGKSPSDVLTGYATGKPIVAPTSLGTSTNVGTGSESGGNRPVSADYVSNFDGYSVDVPPAYAANPDLFIPSKNMDS